MKRLNVDSPNIGLIIFATSFFFLGAILGIFYISPLDAKYLTVLIGSFAGVLAFLGVAYSKEKERTLKEREISHELELNKLEAAHELALKEKELEYEKIKNKKDLLREKIEEMLNILSHCFLNVHDRDYTKLSNDEKTKFFVQMNHIEFIHRAYSIGSPQIFQKLVSHSTEKVILSNEDLITAYDDFRESIMNRVKEELL